MSNLRLTNKYKDALVLITINYPFAYCHIEGVGTAEWYHVQNVYVESGQSLAAVLKPSKNNQSNN